ncbi:MAG: peptide chain release factor N(5)-glutamine methyltransferase [Alphaproteobacteria bacterium]
MENPSEQATKTTRQTVRVAMIAAGRFLSTAGIESPRLDAELLLRHVLGMTQAEFYLHVDDVIGPDLERWIWRLLQRRARREPLAYITGQKEFWSLDFTVTPDVLIPRPETELLVEAALERTRRMLKSPLRILDIGTGSGAVAVCLAKELREAQIIAVDISNAALRVARENAERHGVADRIRFVEGDLFAPLAEEREYFNLILANPPYIRSGDVAELAPEIREWEPITALNGGADGLDIYRRIVTECGGYLAGEGHLLFEIGESMAEAVGQMIARAGGFEAALILRDYAGKDRVIATQKRSRPESVAKGAARG